MNTKELADTQVLNMQIPPPPTPFKRLSELGRAALNRLITSEHSDEPQKRQKTGTFLVYHIHPTIPKSVLELRRRYYDEEEQNE